MQSLFEDYEDDTVELRRDADTARILEKTMAKLPNARKKRPLRLVLIFAALGIYMILKGIRKKKVLERRKDEIEWKKTTLLALVTSVDAFFVGMGLGFLDTAMIEESLVLFPVTVLEAVIGIFAGYRLGLKENRRAYWVGGALLLLASFDVILHYYT